MIKLVIYGEPVSQGRPRFTTASGFPRAYDPAKSRDYKEFVRLSAISQMRGQKPLEGAVNISVRVYRSMAKSLSKKSRELAMSGGLRPTQKPDLDNYLKGIKDALTGVCWLDDSQVVGYIEPTGKYYSDNPRVEVEIMEVQND